MPERILKTRSISLRVSAEEYEALQKLHRSYGARNVSDFARMAIQGVIGPTPATDALLMVKLHQLDVRLELVEQRVARIAGEAMAAAAATNGNSGA